MDNNTYQNLKTDSAENQLKALHKVIRTSGESIDEVVEQMTYAMDLAHHFNQWVEKWEQDGEGDLSEKEISDAKRLVSQTTAMLSSLQSMSGMFDKMWVKSRSLKQMFIRGIY